MYVYGIFLGRDNNNMIFSYHLTLHCNHLKQTALG